MDENKPATADATTADEQSESLSADTITLPTGEDEAPFCPLDQPKKSTKEHKHTKINCEYDAAERVVYAQTVPTDDNIACDKAWLKAKLTELKYNKFRQLEKNQAKVIEACKNGREMRIKIAEAKDAKMEITVAEDIMQAELTITAAQGGDNPTLDQVKQLCERNGVVEGIDFDKIAQLVEKGHCDAAVIALGKEPIDGFDAQFECLVEQCLFKGPQIDDSGKVDFFELQEFVVIEAGIEVMRRTPPTLGTNGYTVQGLAIPATPGEDIPFRDADGVKQCESDPDLLLSTCKGHPVIFPDGVEIDETMTLATVDLSTGNVRFEGSIHIKGDIADNMVVDVTGNVLVDGVIQKACVKAGGDITIKNGVIGGAVKRDQEFTDAASFSAQLCAVGDINARFIDNSYVQAGQIVWVREYIRHSRAIAGKAINLGKQGGRGQLIGGLATATKCVDAKVLGSQADVVTTVEVGVAPEIRRQYDALSHEIQSKSHDLSGFIATFQHLKQKIDDPEQKNGDIEKKVVVLANNIRQLLAELTDLCASRDELDSKMAEANNATVVVGRKAHRNVLIKIKDCSIKLKEDSKSGRFEREGKKIALNK